MKKQIKSVELFHKTYEAPINKVPVANIPEDRKTLRYELMKEENEEYQEAVQNNDLVGIADALGDMMYILCGTIIEHGLQSKMEEVFDEIQRSNMSKLGEDGKPIYREDGKVLRGPNYSKPDIEKIINKKQTLHPDGKKLVLIAALSGNEVLAVDGKLPWHLPDDFKHFKEVTSGHHIIMGRKTFESLPGLLPNRPHIVITRNKDLTIIKKDSDSPVFVVNSLEEAIELCPPNQKSFIIGGGEIYTQAMDLVDEMDLTIVDTFVPMNVVNPRFTLFPPCEEHISKFKVVGRVNHLRDDKHEFSFSFMKLVRK